MWVTLRGISPTGLHDPRERFHRPTTTTRTTAATFLSRPNRSGRWQALRADGRGHLDCHVPRQQGLFRRDGAFKQVLLVVDRLHVRLKKSHCLVCIVLETWWRGRKGRVTVACLSLSIDGWPRNLFQQSRTPPARRPSNARQVVVQFGVVPHQLRCAGESTRERRRRGVYYAHTSVLGRYTLRAYRVLGRYILPSMGRGGKTSSFPGRARLPVVLPRCSRTKRFAFVDCRCWCMSICDEMTIFGLAKCRSWFRVTSGMRVSPGGKSEVTVPLLAKLCSSRSTIAKTGLITPLKSTR